MRVRKLTREERNAVRRRFFDRVPDAELPLGEAIKEMRRMVSMTQPEFARMVGVAPRIIIDLERGVGNPTLDTLRKIGAPFGVVLGWVRTARR